ncbi:cytochrome P450 [Actinomadura rupiterrae]|uniref:cytochrome P450 n=1 Tax=Actinomadura rupiterrae TaxID=559627 RepID=UPI0020A2FB6D|nr:cytochrome P450 [Actinomadura rupiterrae]MCP2342067.1 unspecific monooxygenase [Actinomadura rupiterrae]
MLADLVPHPSGRLPVFGDALKVSPKTRIQDLLTLGRELGPIFEVRIRSARFVIVSSPEIVAEVCDDGRFTKKVVGGVAEMRSVLRDGLFTAHTDEPNWRLAHDILQPAFSQAAMRRYHGTMIDISDELMADLDTWVGRPVEIVNELTKFTFETVTRCGFNYHPDSFARTGPDPVAASLMNIVHRAQAPGFQFPVLRRYKARQKTLKNARDTAHIRGVVDELIRRRVTGESDDAPDLLGAMLNSADDVTGQVLDSDSVANQVLTFIFAGYVTTAAALSFALYHLVTDPDVHRKAREEVDTLWPIGSGPLAYEQVTKMRYLRRVLDESLRLWPTGPAFTRQARKDTTLAGRYPMKAGEAVTVHVPLLHRAPLWGDDPERFDPDRFLPDRIKKRPAHSYKPFGTGERGCIGRQFALHEALIVLASMLHRYDLAGDPGYQLKIRETLSLRADGFNLWLSRRTDGPARPQDRTREPMSVGGGETLDEQACPHLKGEA